MTVIKMLILKAKISLFLSVYALQQHKVLKIRIGLGLLIYTNYILPCFHWCFCHGLAATRIKASFFSSFPASSSFSLGTYLQDRLLKDSTSREKFAGLGCTWETFKGPNERCLMPPESFYLMNFINGKQ